MIPSWHPKPLSVVAAVCLLLVWFSYYWGHASSQREALVPALNKATAPSTPPSRPSSHESNSKSSNKYSRIAKVTIAANTLDSPVIHRAIESHRVQNDLHRYRHFVGTNEVVGGLMESDAQGRPSGAWSKPAYLMSVLVAELEKPESERLEWV